MYLRQLAVEGLRNLTIGQLQLSPSANLFFGPNGSGKTSLLEAIYLLGRGRSFRTRNLKSLINQKNAACTVFGLLANWEEPGALDVPLGVSRGKDGDFKFRMAGEPIHSAAQLVDLLPIQLMTSDSFQLLEGSPKSRRRLVDWGVFHVEHQYRDLWYRFQKTLRQRNSLLRHDRIDRLQLSVWDREFGDLVEKIDSYRQRYVGQYLPVLQEIATSFANLPEPKLVYLPGWDANRDYRQLLVETFERDRSGGFTHLGPHRADIRITCGGRPAAEVLSRGQTKILVALMLIAQGMVFRQQSGGNCVYLLDDLPAELDASYRGQIGRLFASLGSQLFITGVEPRLLSEIWPADVWDSAGKPYLFHVEQGQITKCLNGSKELS